MNILVNRINSNCQVEWRICAEPGESLYMNYDFNFAYIPSGSSWCIMTEVPWRNLYALADIYRRGGELSAKERDMCPVQIQRRMEGEMRVLVCGGRDMDDQALVWGFLGALHQQIPISALIEGGAGGADNLAGSWADMQGVWHEIYVADWSNLKPGAPVRYGRHGPFNPSAGPERNQKMLDHGQPDIVVAFKGGRGTADMVKRAQKAGIRVVSV